MTKKDMARAIAEETGIPQVQVTAIVQRIFDGIIETLVTAGRVELRNFGVFEVKRRKPRKARNPRTGATVKVPAKLVVTFKPGREMGLRVGQLKRVPGPDGERPATSPVEARLSGEFTSRAGVMSKNARRAPRKPAMQYPHLRKKLQKGKVQARTAKKK